MILARVLAAALPALALVGCAPSTSIPPAEPTTTTPSVTYPLDGKRTDAVIDRVVDGDTLVVLIDGQQDRVRILAIDAPEMRPKECGAQSATDHLTDLTPAGSAVTLVADTGEDQRDFFGRILAYVRINGRDVSHELVEAGWAEVYDRYPTSATPHLRDAQREARDEQRGIWGDGCPP